jgi:small subunit ribosomal protein S35
MGEQHPAERKVCLEFCTSDLLTPNGPISPQQRTKLIKLAGVRYNPSTDIIKMSCEKFETPAQNKRYLGDLVDTLIKEAQDRTDMFEDVPFDFRHHSPKEKCIFPSQWRMTDGRRVELDSKRQESLQVAEQRKNGGMLVDGMKLLEGNVRSIQEREEAERERAEVVRVEAGRRRGVGRGNGPRGRMVA